MFYTFIFFFFKQKTAYEMRISDWSSDVCSSDLEPPAQVYLGWADGTRFEVHCCRYPTITEEEKITRIGIPPKQLHFGTSGTMLVQICHCRVDHGMLLARSEEHTSELQSLMRISYAVFCLKNKTITINHTYNTI